MTPKVINTQEEYEEMLAEAERLLARDPKAGSTEADRLELLTLLIENYEKERFKFTIPDPIDAILFRMEEQGLLQRDLVPYIGSKSKVSEVLSRKRPLTIQMIRALHDGLGIPAEVLLQKPEKTKSNLCETIEIDIQRFPIAEMISRGWIKTHQNAKKQLALQLMRDFLTPLGGKVPDFAFCRRTSRSVDLHSLVAWTARVLIRAKGECCPAHYRPGIVTKDFINKVIKLSWSDNGPLLAREFLAKNGIALIIERHLPKTKLDGGSMLGENGPVIGLTIRHDRIDSYWFTLVHELIHVSRHLGKTGVIFIDDLDEKIDDPIEKEADMMTSDILIPKRTWQTSHAKLQRTPSAINELAHQLGIHPAIIAGRIRHEENNYAILKDYVGYHKVRNLFPDIDWN